VLRELAVREPAAFAELPREAVAFAPLADDFALVDVLRAPDVELFGEPDDLAALDRDEVDRPPEERPPRLAPDEELDEPLDALASPSMLHLPDITRCAASATASAMIEPSFVALDMTLLAA
jgi:hypothetical protein